MTSTIDPEELMAYLDGELSLSERRDLERRLKNDPESRNLLERLSDTNRMLHDLYDPVESEPLPVELIESISNMAAAATMHAPTTASLERRPLPQSMPGWGFAIAASFLAMVVGGMGGLGTYWFIDQREGVARNNYIKAFEANAEQALMEALENKPSGTRVAWHDARADAMAEFTVIRTYQREDGSYCREYLRALNVDGVETRTRDLACRTDTNQWKTEVRMSDDGSLAF